MILTTRGYIVLIVAVLVLVAAVARLAESL